MEAWPRSHQSGIKEVVDVSRRNGERKVGLWQRCSKIGRERIKRGDHNSRCLFGGSRGRETQRSGNRR